MRSREEIEAEKAVTEPAHAGAFLPQLLRLQLEVLLDIRYLQQRLAEAEGLDFEDDP